jgi:hypothetical protein
LEIKDGRAMFKPNVIEKAKNFSLVVLFLSTMLLLYFFWGNISLDNFTIKTLSDQPAEDVPAAVSLIQPAQIVASFGSENYTVIPPDKLWYSDSGNDSFVKELRKFGPAENVSVNEIKYDQYQQVRKIRSIWAEFNYNVPFSDFCSIFGIDKPQNYDAIETVTAIGYSTAEKGNSLFVYDGKNEKYYWLASANSDESGTAYGGTEFPGFIDSIEEKGYNSYYRVSSVVGVANDTLIPLSVETNLRSFSFNQELYPNQSDKINMLAEQFFGRNFDFVRKITEESGTIIYMYGYGQNVLIVNTDGSIEYKADQTGETAAEDFSGALETATAFVASHGSWESLNGTKMTPYLKSVITDPDKEKGYRFIFGMKINGSQLFYEAGAPITVDVITGQVTYYKRHLIDFDQKDLDTIEASSSEPAFSPGNLLAQNFNYIYAVLLRSGEVKATPNQTPTFEDIASRVNHMQVGFVKQKNKETTEIKPAWVISVNDTDFYFDLYNAEPIGYSD